MEKISLSSKALCIMSRIVRELLLDQGMVIKLSDPEALNIIIDTCEQSDSDILKDLLTDLDKEMRISKHDTRSVFTFTKGARRKNSSKAKSIMYRGQKIEIENA